MAGRSQQQHIVLILAILLVVGLSLAATGIAAQVSAQTGTTPWLLPFGDSITSGYVDSFGYRDHLQDLLGINTWDFIGPFTDPDSDATYDVDHAGIGGQSTTRIKNRTLETLNDHLVGSPPNSLILLHAGTNDILADLGFGTAQEKVDSYVANMSDIIDMIHAHDPSVSVFVALIVPNALNINEERVQLYNATLRTMLENYQLTKSNLYIVDMHTPFVSNPNWLTEWFDSDGTHPNDVGYTVIANTWYAAIYDALLDGPPTSTPSPTPTPTATPTNTPTATPTDTPTPPPTHTPASTSAPQVQPQRNAMTTTTPTLTWTPTSWAVAYEIEVDNQADFSNPEYRSSELPPETLQITTAPLLNGTYYWRVRAKQPSGHWGAWSQPDSFVVVGS